MIKKGKILKSDFCRGLYIFTLCFNLIMQSLAGTNIQKILFIPKSTLYSMTPKISFLLFFIVILMNKSMSKRKVYLSFFLGLVAVIVTGITNNYALALVFLAIIACPPKITISDVAKWEHRGLFCLICCTVLLASASVIPSDIVYRGDAIRNSCGFTSANAFANNTLIWVLLFGLHKKEKWTWKNTVFCCIAAWGIFSLTNSRMAFAMSVFISLSFLVLKHKHDHIEKVIYKVSKVCFPILMVICYVCSWLYKSGYFTPQLSMLNVVMSYRLGFMRNYLRDYGVKPFGQIIRVVSYSQALRTGEAWSGLDNSYMYILICWGLIISVILCVLYYQLGRFNYNRFEKHDAFVVIVLCIIGLTENYLSLIGDNISIVMIAIMLSQNILSLRKRQVKFKE